VRTRHYIAAALVVPALAGALSAGLLIGIGGSPKQVHAHRHIVRPAHGLMLFPLSDPDGHRATTDR
jgi:hypothetical protein